MFKARLLAHKSLHPSGGHKLLIPTAILLNFACLSALEVYFQRLNLERRVEAPRTRAALRLPRNFCRSSGWKIRSRKFGATTSFAVTHRNALIAIASGVSSFSHLIVYCAKCSVRTFGRGRASQGLLSFTNRYIC